MSENQIGENPHKMAESDHANQPIEIPPAPQFDIHYHREMERLQRLVPRALVENNQPNVEGKFGAGGGRPPRQRFRRRPPVIEAEQYLGTDIEGLCPCQQRVQHGPHIHSPEYNEIIPVAVGDWLVPLPRSTTSYQVIKAADFAAQYEAVV